MSLLRAELTKLRRPLTWFVAATAVVATLLFAWQGVRNAWIAQGPVSTSPGATLSCHDLALPPGPLCERAIAVDNEIRAYRQQQSAARPSTRHNARPTDAVPVENPLAAGKVALGLMASLGGALLIFLLAAAHVGGEWNGRTINTVLVTEGRRWRVLAAKAASLWIVATAITVVDWAALAAVAPILKAAYPLDSPVLSSSAAWSAVASDAARAPLVIAAFTVLGIAAAVIVRNALGGFALAAAVLIASLSAAGNFAVVAPYTLAYWVAGWMRFRSHGYVIYHFWVDGFPASVHVPGTLAGLFGLLAVGALAVAVSIEVFRRLDIT
jgi:ABC-type transport system involved in multi-copper enzyme maturation permease subunit